MACCIEVITGIVDPFARGFEFRTGRQYYEKQYIFCIIRPSFWSRELLLKGLLERDGSFLRHDLATSAAEGDELMIQRHNAVVKPNDRVYFLGDVAISKALHSSCW